MDLKRTHFLKRTVLSATTFLFTFITAAQGKIETDRPDQTETPVLVPRKYFQAELGFTKENQNSRNYTLVHPTGLFKYGLTNGFELRLETALVTDHVHLIPNPQTNTTFLPPEIGFKLHLLEEKEARPKTSLIAHAGLPFFGSKDYQTLDIGPSFRFTMQNTLSKTVGLGYNVGAQWDGESASPEWLYTFAPGFNLTDKWYAYIEAFGFLRSNHQPDHNADAGVAYAVNNNMKIDLSGGVGLSPSSIKNYVALGFSFRVNTARKND